MAASTAGRQAATSRRPAADFFSPVFLSPVETPSGNVRLKPVYVAPAAGLSREHAAAPLQFVGALRAAAAVLV